MSSCLDSVHLDMAYVMYVVSFLVCFKVAHGLRNGRASGHVRTYVREHTYVRTCTNTYVLRTSPTYYYTYHDSSMFLYMRIYIYIVITT